MAKHLSHSYGSNACDVVKHAALTGKRWPLIGRRLSVEFPYIEAEIKYSITNEYACTVIDFLAYRTRLAFQNVHIADELVPRIADVMAKELGWTKARKKVCVIFYYAGRKWVQCDIPLHMWFILEIS